MYQFIKKYEKYIYPMVMGLSLISAAVSFYIGKEYFWQIMTFLWANIAWVNFQKLQK